MAELIAGHTGQTVEQVQADSDRDRWFTAEEAKEYGIVITLSRVVERLTRSKTSCSDLMESLKWVKVIPHQNLSHKLSHHNSQDFQLSQCFR